MPFVKKFAKMKRGQKRYDYIIEVRLYEASQLDLDKVYELVRRLGGEFEVTNKIES